MKESVKVLVIEDDADVAEMYRTRLTEDGYDVFVGNDGADGLRLAEAESPDFIYLDLMLPDIDGIGVLEHLRGLPATAQAPVIILSSPSDPMLPEGGLRLGALEFLVKMNVTKGRAVAGMSQRAGALPAGRA